ncbi:MAG: proton-conducting transporter transmembrane domain-containing protein [Candidatus Dormibacteria bacterium]
MIALPILAAAAPLLGSVAGLATARARLAGLATIVGALLGLLMAVATAIVVIPGRPLASSGSFVYVDGLGAFFAITVAIVVFLASLGSFSYIATEQRRGVLSSRRIRVYFVVFGLFATAMMGAVETANLGLLFILVEAATLASVVMVPIEGRTEGLEAGWKYVIISSLGITIALAGTLFVFYAATGLAGSPDQHLTWAYLVAHAHQLSPVGVRLGFLLAVVGYGTKVGLAPMHTWLPDAHSEAPSPASAMLSGALLNVGMYAIIRFVAIANGRLGPAYASHVLLVFGFLSIAVGAFFMIHRRDFKRLFAYSSVEHMGIIAVGLGFGGVLGLYGALLHTLNHSVGKAVLFLTGGTLVLAYGTRRTDRIGGALTSLPLTGGALLIGSLAIVGSPPFGLFISEFVIVRAGLSAAYPALVGLFLLLLVIVFIGFMHTTSGMAAGQPQAAVVSPYQGRAERWSAAAPLLLGLCGLLLLGLWIPGWLNTLLLHSVALIR